MGHSHDAPRHRRYLRVTKSADSRIVDLLASSGVKMDVWHLPAELWEARPTGAPVSYDDLLDFHLMLQDETWFEQLAERTSDVEQ